jgi:hypothetical protein
MSPFAIVWGKVGGGITFMLLVVLSSLPIVSTCLVLGGIGASAVAWFYVILILTALCFGLVGLTVSALSNKTYLAVIITYVVIGVLSVATALPSMMFMSSVGTTMKSVLHHLWSISPFVAMASVVQPDLLRTSTWTAGLPGAYSIYAWMSLIASAGMITFVFFYLRRCPAPKPHRERVIDEALTERLSKWPFYLINPRGHRGMIGRFINPVLIKELRTMLFGRIVYLVRGVYFCVFVSMGLVLLAAFSTFLYATSIIAVFTVSFQMILVLFLAPIFSAPLISSEVESGRFDLLRLTKMSSLRMVSGKFQSVILPLAILMLATVPPYLALGYIDKSLVPGILRSSVTLLATLLFISAVGLFFSSLCRRTATSIAGTYVVVVVTCVLSLVGLLAPGSFSHGMLQKMFVVNPVVTMLSETALTHLRTDFTLWLPNLYLLLISSVVLLLAATVRVSWLMSPR